MIADNADKLTPAPSSDLDPRTFPAYFTKISSSYARSTGRSTQHIFLALLARLPRALFTPTTFVHDNASGPCTATLALLAYLDKEDLPAPKRVICTDLVPGMVESAEQVVGQAGWRNVHVSPADSMALGSGYSDACFDISICNFSVFTFGDGVKALREMRRTVRSDGGMAVVTVWKRFTVIEIVHAAQRKVKGEQVELMKQPNTEWMQEGYLVDRMIDAGWDKERMDVFTQGVVVKGDDLMGLRTFMCGGLMRMARAGWSLEEEARWEGAIDEAIEEVKRSENTEGVPMEAWVVVSKR